MYSKIQITGILEVVTGMHIGGSSAFSAIGAVDAPVIKDIRTNRPMIPGSSLKGKMRTLLAKRYNEIIQANPNNDDERITRVFGSAKKDDKGKVKPSKILISDMFVVNEDEIRNRGIQNLTEVKFENSINRATAVANPRQIERAVKGLQFGVDIIYELSGMTADEQREALGKFTETGELTHKDVKDMKAEKAAGQQVSESDTETEIGMNPPEVRAGDEYETPHPEGITSICYSCTEYETCNVKTGTCTSCDQYKNRTEAYKTDEQRYSEEQDAIDRETKKKLREMEQEEKMQKLPSTAPEEIKTIRVSQDKFEEYTGEYRKPYMITKDDGFKVGNVVKLVVFAAGKATGETADMRITCKDDDITCSGLSDGWCVIGLGEA